MSSRLDQRADLAWGMLVMACDSGGLAGLPDSTRQGLLKIVRTYGEARFEQGRARESEIVSVRAQEIDRDRQQNDLQRRLRERRELAL